MIPLAELVETNPGQVVATDDPEAISAFYSQTYALVRFLREEDYGKRLSNFHWLLLGGLHGTWPLDATTKRIAADRNIPLTTHWNKIIGSQLFRHYIDDNFDQLEAEYKAFCKKIVYYIRLKQ